MITRIFIGGLLFVAIFITVGYVLVNEGLLLVQEQDRSGRMQVFAAGSDGRSIENGADMFTQYCASCHGDDGEGVPGKGPQLNPYLFTTRFPELKAANYPNSLRNFVKIAIAGGRPDYTTYWATKGETYAAPMQTWGDQFGGPLRGDQVESLTDYIMGWEAEAGQPAEIVEFTAIGDDVDQELSAGNAARGQQLWDKTTLYASTKTAPCSACHSLEPGQTLVGPSLAGIGTRGAEIVSGQDAYTYIRHSIQLPSEHIVSGFETADGRSLMPEGLGNDMSAQDLADLIEFLLTQQ
jgi:cytochrome c2